MRLAALLAALALVVAACGGDGDESPAPGAQKATTGTDATPAESVEGGWASEAELAWLKEFGRWAKGFNGDLTELQSWVENPANRKELEAASELAVVDMQALLEPLQECGETLEAEVPKTPTDRLEDGAELMRQACQHYEQAADLLLKGLKEKDVDAVEESTENSAKAIELGGRLNEILPPGEARKVPVIDAPSKKTRVNPLYGELASEIAGNDTEARCWSRADWPKVLREERAMTGMDLPPDTLGVTGIGAARINLGPDVCEQLDLLVYKKKEPKENDAELFMAYAIVTLAHEAQHRKGVVEEPIAECYGMQKGRELAKDLGASPAYADTLMEVYWADYDPKDPTYGSNECREGGELDLGEGGDNWP